MRITTLAALFCSSLFSGAALAAADTHASETNPPKKAIPDLFSDKSHSKPAVPQNSEKSEGKPFVNAPAIKAASTVKAAAVIAPLAIFNPVVITKKVAPPTQGSETVAKQAPDLAPAKEAATVKNPTSVSDQAHTVVQTVEAWTQAWSAKDTDKYFTFYAADFHAQDGSTRAAWENLRRERIGKPAQIRVHARKIKVDFSDESHATVQFQQSYHAGNIRSADRKTLLMVKSGNNWLIQEERTK